LKSGKGHDYCVKASDYNIADKSTGEEVNSADASGPSFPNVSVFCAVDSSETSSSDVQNRTVIT